MRLLPFTGAILTPAAGSRLKSLREGALTALYIGVAIGVTLWGSNFSDYMLLEDLGLETSAAGAALQKVSLGERFLLNMSALLTLGGLGSLVLSLFLRRRDRDGS